MTSMKYDDDQLKAAFQAAAAIQRPRNRQDCPSPESLARSFTARAPKRIKRQIIDHVSKCSYCKEEFAFYHELQKIHKEILGEYEGAANEEVIGALLKDSRPRIQPLLNYAFLCLGILIISTVVMLLFTNKNISESERSITSTVILDYPLSSHHMTEILNFRWKGFPSAQYYVLELFNDSLEFLWTSPPVQDLHIRLPLEMSDEIRPGRVFYWMITAYIGSSKIGESKLMRFVIH